MRGTAFPRKTPLQSQADDDRRSGLRNIAGDASVAAQRRERATHRLAALGEMTGGIAHDFRNLLTVIESGLRLAQKKASEPERVRAYIAATREGIDRGLQLTS